MSKVKVKQIFAICLGHFMNDVFMNLLIPLSFMFKDKMGLTFAQQAMISTVIIGLGSFGQPVIGHAVDKKGRSELLILSILWIGIFTSVSGYINHYYLLLVISGLGALASALYHPLGSALVIHLLGKTKGAGLSIFISVGSFAIGFAPFIAIPLTAKFGLESLILFLIPAVITAMIMYIFKIHKIRFGENQLDNSPHKKINRTKVGWVSSLVGVSLIRSLIFKSFLLAFGVQILLSKGTSEVTAGIAVSVFMWITSGGTFLGGYLTDRYGGKKIMILSNLVITILLIGLIVSDNIAALLMYCILGFGAGLGNTPNITMAQEMIPQNTSLATGLIFGLGGGLGAVIMYFYGIIADEMGLLMSLALLMIPVLIMDAVIFLNPVYEDGERVKLIKN